MTTACDFLVIGAGISGAAAACELAAKGRVVVLEGESAPGYHSTGRSAALFTPNYGNRTVRALIAAGRSFFEHPPPGFADHPLLRPRGAIAIAQDDARRAIEEVLALGAPGAEIVEIDRDRAVELAPLLRRDAFAFAAYEPGVKDIDVHALHQGFLRRLAARGGSVVCDAPARALARRHDHWQVEAGGRTYTAPVVVNAAGAWADEIAGMAGVAPVGLVPKRRTVLIVDAPHGSAPDGWPMVDEVGLATEFYVKPEAGKLLLSPGDATPTPPCDAAPEELDMALAVDWLERRTEVRVRQIRRKWAGLRSFVADKAPVVGPAPGAEGFHWLAAQGGYGIMLAPALARAVAGLATNGELPRDLVALGLTAADLSPGRLAPATSPTL